MISKDVYKQFEQQASELVESYTSQIKDQIDNVQARFQKMVSADVEPGTSHCVDDLEERCLKFMDRLEAYALQIYSSILSDFSKCYEKYVPNGERPEMPLLKFNFEVYVNSIKDGRRDIPRADEKEKEPHVSQPFSSFYTASMKILFGSTSEQRQKYDTYKDEVERAVNSACMQIRGKLQRYVQKVKIAYDQMAYAECISK